MMKCGAIVTYISNPLVLNRCGNDSFFASLGYTKRRLIDLSFPNIARSVFHDNPKIIELVTSVVENQYFNIKVMLSDKRSSILSDGKGEEIKLAQAYKEVFETQKYFFIKMLIWRLIPLNGLSILKTIGNKLTSRRRKNN